MRDPHRRSLCGVCNRKWPAPPSLWVASRDPSDPNSTSFKCDLFLLRVLAQFIKMDSVDDIVFWKCGLGHWSHTACWPIILIDVCIFVASEWLPYRVEGLQNLMSLTLIEPSRSKELSRIATWYKPLRRGFNDVVKRVCEGWLITYGWWGKWL